MVTDFLHAQLHVMRGGLFSDSPTRKGLFQTRGLVPTTCTEEAEYIALSLSEKDKFEENTGKVSFVISRCYIFIRTSS
ncbi:hypothetical protein BaRGS_00007766 [Batillaria attramentaria]|uniref:Uncharacterized protein n=1 Tax=Batillaria attramentaria TaxID=370345 RepID=A0ABD0LNS1_9CAEN